MDIRFVGVVALITSVFVLPCLAQGRTVARLFWQDDSNATVCCGNLKKSAGGWSIERVGSKKSNEYFGRRIPRFHLLMRPRFRSKLSPDRAALAKK